MTEQRKNTRFEMALPVTVAGRGRRYVSCAGETINLSSGGVLFQSDVALMWGEDIDFKINYSRDPVIDLHCTGSVMRCEPEANGDTDRPKYLIAAGIDRYKFVRGS